jgi:CheY-like chemotaxis protein
MELPIHNPPEPLFPCIKEEPSMSIHSLDHPQ